MKDGKERHRECQCVLVGAQTRHRPGLEVRPARPPEATQRAGPEPAKPRTPPPPAARPQRPAPPIGRALARYPRYLCRRQRQRQHAPAENRVSETRPCLNGSLAPPLPPSFPHFVSHPVPFPPRLAPGLHEADPVPAILFKFGLFSLIFCSRRDIFLEGGLERGFGSRTADTVRGRE